MIISCRILDNLCLIMSHGDTDGNPRLIRACNGSLERSAVAGSAQTHIDDVRLTGAIYCCPIFITVSGNIIDRSDYVGTR